MRFVQMTKLVSGYIPTRVWVNPDKVLYVEEVIQRRSQGGDTYIEVPKGARLVFGEDDVIAVSETPAAVLRMLSGEPQADGTQVDETYEAAVADLHPSFDRFDAWEAEHERKVDALFGPDRG